MLHIEPAVVGDPDTLKMILNFEASKLMKDWKLYSDVQGFFNTTDHAGAAAQFLERLKAAIEKAMEALKEPDPEPAFVLRRPSGSGAASSSHQPACKKGAKGASEVPGDVPQGH